MGDLFAAALPVLPGQSERVRNFAKELAAVRGEYDELNDRWWLAFLRDVHGIDLTAMQPAVPELVFDSSR